MSSLRRGREKEVEEIVTFKRAAQVGRLLLGELDTPMQPIFPEMFLEKPRSQLKAEREKIRVELRGELQKFCQNNFTNLQPADLAKLYQPLFDRNSTWILPLSEFIKIVGGVKGNVFRDAPLHSTVHISRWGLQTDFPERHLMNDVAISFNELIRVEKELKSYEKLSMGKVKSASVRPEVATLQSRRYMHRRVCVLSCFNLLEAYINGLAWEYMQSHDVSGLSQTKKNMLTEASENIIKRIIDIPTIVAERSDAALSRETEPLKSFVEIVKPYRDSIVHASPFAAPQKFGGYDKLAKLYELNTTTVNLAVTATLGLISYVHRFIGGQSTHPSWVYSRNFDDTFNIVYR